MSLLSEVLQEAEKASNQEFKKYRDDLLPKVKDLNERIQLLSWALQQNFIDSYFNFTTTKSLEQLNFKNRKGNIISDYESLSKEFIEFKEKFALKDEDLDNHFTKLNSSLSKMKDLVTVVQGQRVLHEANHEFNRFNYSGAILKVKELKEELKIITFEGNAVKALLNLKAQVENQLALYIAQLSVEWEDLFSWSEKKGVNYLTYSLSVQQSDPLLLQKILKTLFVTNRLNAELGLFSHFFIEKLLHNVIRHNCEIFTEDHIGAIIFNIKMDLNDMNKPNYQTIFNNLTAVFEFLQSTLGSQFETNQKFVEVFAESIREKFFNKIVEDCIRNNLPSCDSSYQHYKNLVIELDSFNKFLIELRFVEANKSPLNKYIDDTECVLYNKKCNKLLYDVRELLNQGITSGTVVVGSLSSNTDSESMLDESEKDNVWDLTKPVFLPRCVISQNVMKIMTLITEHLEESARLPQKYSTQLVSYIKDIAVMYQCLVPNKFKVNIETSPLDIALFFNNCFYLAHSLVGPPWRNMLPADLADLLTTALVESIQDLRVLGLEKVSLYLQNQKNVIVQSIEPNELPPWTEDSYEQFDSAINKAITLMRDLKQSWLHILPSKMYDMSMSTVVQTLCQSILQRVFADSRQVGEDLVYMLSIRLEDIKEQIITLFEDTKEIDKKINCWSKFTKLPILLKAQMLEISEIWKSNEDIKQCYTCEEVRQIVKMRFPDNKYRLKIQKEIQ